MLLETSWVPLAAVLDVARDLAGRRTLFLDGRGDGGGDLVDLADGGADVADGADRRCP